LRCEIASTPLTAGGAAKVTSGTVSAPSHGKVTLHSRHVYRILTKPAAAEP